MQSAKHNNKKTDWLIIQYNRHTLHELEMRSEFGQFEYLIANLLKEQITN